MQMLHWQPVRRSEISPHRRASSCSSPLRAERSPIKRSRTITRVFSENRINQFLDLLEKDLQAIDALTRQLIAESREAKIPQSTAAFRDAADAFIDGQSQLANTLEKLNQALDSLRELADYLNQDPSSLISGKKKPGVLRQP